MKKINFSKFLSLSTFFSKKNADEEEGEEEKISSEANTEGRDLNIDSDEGDDIDSGDVDDDDDKKPRSSRSMAIAIAGILALFIGISIGVGAYYFGENETTEVSKKTYRKETANQYKGPLVSLAIPPKATKGNEKGGLNRFLGASPKLPKQKSVIGKLDNSEESRSKGIITPSMPSKISDERISSAKIGKSIGILNPTPSGNTAGRSALSSKARAVGIIGGRFGGRADPLGGALNAIGGQAQSKGAGIVIPSVTSVTMKSLSDYQGGKPLGPTPVNTLIEKKEGLSGFLPKAGKGDDVSWKVYARPYIEEKKNDEEKEEDKKRLIKKVAVVVMGLGLSKASSMAAIKKLPPEVSLALDPYATNLSDWLVRARIVGHEVLLTLPMESEKFPVQDAGPLALKTSLSKEDNIKRLEVILSQVTGYFGVATVLGSKFGDSKVLMTEVLNNVKDRGLMLLTTGSQNSLLAPKIARNIELPLVVGDVSLDAEPSPAGIQAQLRRLEKILKNKRVAVAIAQPYPTTLRRLIAWTKTLEEKKITLVPVSALINKQFKKKK
jgi:polysaccharide deacetylase 2 family uncharacterized protein YibQ